MPEFVAYWGNSGHRERLSKIRLAETWGQRRG